MNVKMRRREVTLQDQVIIWKKIEAYGENEERDFNVEEGGDKDPLHGRGTLNL